MLARNQRLNRTEDIRHVLRTGKRLHAQYYQVVITATGKSQPARCAVVVSRQVQNSAVKRHRIQRQLRVIAQELLTACPAGYDMVIVARAAIVGRSLMDLRAGLDPIKQYCKQLFATHT